MCSGMDNTILLVLSSLIRKSAGHRIFAPHRSLSQLVTSFFGAMYQGIHLNALCSLNFLSLDLAFSLFSLSFRYFTFHKNSMNFNSTNFVFYSSEASFSKLVTFFLRINLKSIFLKLPFVLVLFSSLCSCQSSFPN